MEMAEWQTCFGPASRWSEFSFDNMVLSEATLAGRPVYLSAACPSTMDLAWELEAGHQFFDMSWITAITQTRGRGQANRPWHSAPGSLYATIRLPLCTADATDNLSLALALILADVLADEGLLPQIKWPNDVLISGGKVAGILLEQRRDVVMAGMGINVGAMPESGNGHNFCLLPATSLADQGCLITAPSLWKILTREIDRRLGPLVACPGDLARQLNTFLAFKDEWVTWDQAHGNTVLVKILGVDPQGGAGRFHPPWKHANPLREDLPPDCYIKDVRYLRPRVFFSGSLRKTCTGWHQQPLKRQNNEDI